MRARSQARITLSVVALLNQNGTATTRGCQAGRLGKFTSQLQIALDGTQEKAYLTTSGDDARTQKRNEIILARMRGYDIEFVDFERQLYGQSNTVTIGSDIVGLILGGLTATTGNATTKAALGAASIGVLGANTAINKDLYYQKTIPALLAQMEANRLKAKLPILQGLAQPESKYSLMLAYIDLDSYKSAGSIPGAISSVTQDAANAKDKAENSVITFMRTSTDILQFPNIQAVEVQLKILTSDQQFIDLAKTMEPNLATRPAEIQRLVKTIDPSNARLIDARKAKQVIKAWIAEENMTPANKKQWIDAITSVSK